MTAFCTCPPSGNQVDGLPLALVRMLCQLVGLGSVERANGKFTKKCILLMKVSMQSRLRIIEISLLIVIKVR